MAVRVAQSVQSIIRPSGIPIQTSESSDRRSSVEAETQTGILSLVKPSLFEPVAESVVRFIAFRRAPT